jgi:DNA repair protein RadA
MPKEKNEPNKLRGPTTEESKAEKPTDAKTPADLGAEVTPSGLCSINGLSPAVAQKLIDSNIRTLFDLATAREDEVGASANVSTNIAKGWIDQARNTLLGKMTLKKVEEFDKEKKASQITIKLGSAEFNKLLGGGIMTQSITGLTGRLATGKTQICEEACVYCIAVLKEVAVYIETEPDTIHLERMKQIAQLKGYKDVDWGLLYVCGADQIPTIKAQYLQYRLIMREIEKGLKVRLIVIDSFNAKIRAGWGKSEMLPLRTRELAEHFNLMELMASKWNIAWIVTCQTIAPPRPDQGLQAEVKFGDSYYPVGGDYLLHSVNNWIGLSQIKANVWRAILFDSSYLPRGTCEFTLTASGIKDGVR